jgi:hypothetical protein
MALRSSQHLGCRKLSIPICLLPNGIAEKSGRRTCQDAAEALEAGYDGLALRRLAGLIKPNSMDVGDLFQRALLEIGTVKILSQQEAVFFLSRMVATDIVEGRIDPQRGAGILAGYAAMLYYPPILNRFSQLGEMAFWGEYVSSDPKLVHEIMVEAHQLLASLPI